VVITFTPVGTSAANGLFGLSDLDWAVLLGITAAVLVGIGVVFTWRRRRGQADPPES
jgi:LPXTG-motif cell wall-anchored protein